MSVFQRKQAYLGLFALLLGGLFLLSPHQGFAEPVRSANVESEMVSEVNSIRPGETFWIAFQFQMDDHWHIYWRNAGDSGLPPTITWDLPDEIRLKSLHWPYPKILRIPPVTTYGFEGEMILLAEMTADSSLSQSDPVTIRAHIDYLACEINCIPGSANHTLELPVSGESKNKNSQMVALFERGRSFLPIQSDAWSVLASVQSKSIQLKVQSSTDVKSVGEVTFFAHDPELVDHGADQRMKRKGNDIRLKVQRSTLKEGPVSQLSGILLASNGWDGRGVPQALSVNVTTGDSTAGGAPQGVMTILLFAFLGGLILNLMPCVLPVLSLKILGFAERAQKEHHSPWQHGFMFSFGVISSFWVLALFLISLRGAGEAVGWGFQLQSPLFIAVLSILFTGFFINLLGVFEIGASLTRLGLMNEHQTGVMGSFMNGVVATIVATPCTAPFMGTAIGFGLTQSTMMAFLIFTFLGLGMASPYLLLSVFPHAVDWIPKPGKWMVTFKRILAIPLFLTVVWLLWVFQLQKGTVATIFLIAGLSILGFGLMAYGKGQRDHAHWKQAKQKMAICLVLSVVVIFVGISFFGVTSKPTSVVETNGVIWQPFSEDKLQEALKEGRPIFVDFTAAWCITCQVNKKVALTHEDVLNKLKELNVITFVADWTSKDQAIEKALARYGRSSIPLYVLYAGGVDSEPVLLPEILTPKIVIEALDRLKT